MATTGRKRRPKGQSAADIADEVGGEQVAEESEGAVGFAEPLSEQMAREAAEQEAELEQAAVETATTAVAKSPSKSKKSKGKKAAAEEPSRPVGRPPKSAKPTRDWIVTYVAATMAGKLPRPRRVTAPDQSSAICLAHKINKISDTHRYNVTVVLAE